MGNIVVTTQKHEAMVAERQAQIDTYTAQIEQAKKDMKEHESVSAEEEKKLQDHLKELEAEMAKLEQQQSALQADYSEMEAARQAHEEQIIKRTMLRFTNRFVGICFSEWKDFIVEIVQSRDREQYSGQVEKLEKTNKELRKGLEGAKAELERVEKETAELKAKQLILRILNREVATCFNQWRGFAKDNVEERHQRQVEQLQRKIEETEKERNKLRKDLDSAEWEGLKIAMTKFELEEQDVQKENQINELTGALTEARDVIEQQVQLWPATSKKMRRELERLDQAAELTLARELSTEHKR